MTAYIGYNNLIEAGAVTVTDEAVGFPKENAYDWLTYDWWQAASIGTVHFNVDLGAAAVVNSWGVASHSLGDNGASIKPQYSSDGVTWYDFDTAKSPASDQVLFYIKSAIVARYWRFEISSAAAASLIGELFLGSALTLPYGMPTGFTPPSVGYEDTILNNTSQGGAFLGRSLIRTGKRFTISQRKVEASWVLANWPAFYQHARVKPFFFAWNAESYPDDVSYCWAYGSIKQPTYEDNLNMRWQIDVEGV